MESGKVTVEVRIGEGNFIALTTELIVYDKNVTNILHCVPQNVPFGHFPYLRQILTDFQNSFTGTYCGRLAIMLVVKYPTTL